MRRGEEEECRGKERSNISFAPRFRAIGKSDDEVCNVGNDDDDLTYFENTILWVRARSGS